MSRWSKNIFKEEGRFEARIPAYFDRFKVRKFRFFAGQCGHVFAGLNRISDYSSVSRWSKNIFKEEGRLEARIPAYFDRFKVRKFRFFAGQCGHVFAGLSRISDYSSVSRWSKIIFKEEGRLEARIPAYFDRFKVWKFHFFAGQSGHVFAWFNSIFDSIFLSQVVEKHFQRRREIRGKDSCVFWPICGKKILLFAGQSKRLIFNFSWFFLTLQFIVGCLCTKKEENNVHLQELCRKV